MSRLSLYTSIRRSNKINAKKAQELYNAFHNSEDGKELKQIYKQIEHSASTGNSSIEIERKDIPLRHGVVDLLKKDGYKVVYSSRNTIEQFKTNKNYFTQYTNPYDYFGYIDEYLESVTVNYYKYVISW